jgi:D-alanyl-lipoteichoic acid acyltransferase DltB (MBOAT superfamily)
MRPYRIFIFFALAAVILVVAAILSPSVINYSLRETPFFNLIVNDTINGERAASDHLSDTIAVTPVPESDSFIQYTDSATIQSPDSGMFNLAPRFTGKVIAGDPHLRVIIFGDSQLEGDRLSSYIRTTLQKKMGGYGPGLLQPLMPVMYTRTVEVRSSPNWNRYNYLSYRDGSLPHRKIGPFMSICRFLKPDSVAHDPATATVRITPSKFTSPQASVYKKLRLFYGNLNGVCDITIYSSDYKIASDTLKTGEGPFEFAVSFNAVTDLKMRFSGTSSPDVYGFSIESDSGIIVDNIPHRGSAGLEFTMADRQNQKALLSMLNPDLIILHYGLNVVRNVRDDYTYYQKGLERQFHLLKDLCPSADIILMGLTDMADNFDGTMASFPNIENIRDAQKIASANAGIGFWDAYDAMGGANSILKWTSLAPPLAQKDYTHLTYTGSDSLASLFLIDLIPKPDTLPPTIPTEDTLVVLFADSLTKLTETCQPYLLSAPDPKTNCAQLTELVLEVLAYDPDSPFIFSNIAFWIFMLFLMAGYSIVYKKPFLRNFYLFLFSLFFYYKSGGLFLFLLIISTITDYTAGRLISGSRSRYVRILWLVISLVVNLGMLGYFKYYGFVIDSINSLAGTSLPSTDLLASMANSLFLTSFDVSSVVLPVGISFFTFQTISYTVDVYRGRVAPVKNILDFGFYVSFFPQLVAGPIVRASEFVPQLYAKFSLTKREFGHALFLIAKGLTKKMIISDYISVNFVDRVFGAPEIYSGAENLMAVYGYGLQIYCDFSGYTDIAIGVALLLGFRLPVNFNSPYKATGISDFWRRWHISLSRWLRDYLYISLGGNRRGSFRTGINLLITMTLGGLWHGASGRFIIWGLLHGLGLIINKIWNHIVPASHGKRPLITILQIFITFNFVSFAWIFFRAETNELSLLMIKNIFTGLRLEHFTALFSSYPFVVILIIAGYTIHFLPETIKEATRALFVRSHVIIQFIALMGLVLILMRMQAAGIQPFIYFRF